MPSHTQLSNYDDLQKQRYSEMGASIGQDSYYAKLARGDQSAFQEMEAPAMRQFQAMQGQTASRFSGGLGGGSGAMSARRGSGFQNTMNQQTSDFAQQLQANRLGLRNQAIQSLHGMTNDFLGHRPFQWVEKQRKPKRDWLGAGMGLINSAVGGFAGGGGFNNLFGGSGDSGGQGFYDHGGAGAYGSNY